MSSQKVSGRGEKLDSNLTLCVSLKINCWTLLTTQQTNQLSKFSNTERRDINRSSVDKYLFWYEIWDLSESYSWMLINYWNAQVDTYRHHLKVEVINMSSHIFIRFQTQRLNKFLAQSYCFDVDSFSKDYNAFTPHLVIFYSIHDICGMRGMMACMFVCHAHLILNFKFNKSQRLMSVNDECIILWIRIQVPRRNHRPFVFEDNTSSLKIAQIFEFHRSKLKFLYVGRWERLRNHNIISRN